jgi:hypothetical protein
MKPATTDSGQNSPEPTPMKVPDRKYMELLYRLFNEFTLADQRSYYKSALKKYRESAHQVNLLRAVFSLLTGLASAAAGFLVQATYVNGNCGTPGAPDCAAIQVIVTILLIVAIIAPAIGGAFGTLADLYQWDRLVTIYDVSLENIEVADSRSPDPGMDDELFWLSLRAFTEGTLNVMRDETAQWGQLIRTPEQLDKFIEQARERSQQAGSVGAVTDTASRMHGGGGADDMSGTSQ